MNLEMIAPLRLTRPQKYIQAKIQEQLINMNKTHTIILKARQGMRVKLKDIKL